MADKSAVSMPSASADNGSHPTCVWSRALAPLLHLKENEAQNAVRQSSDRFWRTMLSWSERDIVIQDVADAQEDTDNDGGDDVGLRISSRHVSMDDGSAIFIAGEQLHEEDRLSEIGDTGDGHEDEKLSVSVVGNRSVLAHLRHGSVRSPWFNMLPSSRLRFVWRAYTCASCRATSKVGALSPLPPSRSDRTLPTFVAALPTSLLRASETLHVFTPQINQGYPGRDRAPTPMASNFKLQEDIEFHLGRVGAYRMSPATSTSGSCMTKMQMQQWQRHIAETFSSNFEL